MVMEIKIRPFIGLDGKPSPELCVLDFKFPCCKEMAGWLEARSYDTVLRHIPADEFNTDGACVFCGAPVRWYYAGWPT